MIFNEMTGFSKERKTTIHPPFSKSCKTDVMPSIQKRSGIKKRNLKRMIKSQYFFEILNLFSKRAKI